LPSAGWFQEQIEVLGSQSLNNDINNRTYLKIRRTWYSWGLDISVKVSNKQLSCSVPFILYLKISYYTTSKDKHV